MIVNIFEKRLLVEAASIVGRRRENQDSYGWVAITSDGVTGTVDASTVPAGKDMFVAVVCDGMGGLQYGKEASSLIVLRTLEWALSVDRGSLDSILEDYVNDALPRMEEESIANYPDSGTTLSMVIGFEDRWVSMHLGDSRLYGINLDGRCFRTEDHSPVEAMRMAGLISEDEMESHPMKNLISYFVGGHYADMVQVEPLNDWQFLAICSDGAYGCMSRNRFVNLISNEDADRIIQECYECGSTDNITLIRIKKIVDA